MQVIFLTSNSFKIVQNIGHEAGAKAEELGEMTFCNLTLRYLFQVKLIEILDSMEESEFNVKIAGKRTWSTFLSDGTVIQLKISADGTSPELSYIDRGDYCQAVKKIRMAESDLQVNTNLDLCSQASDE